MSRQTHRTSLFSDLIVKERVIGSEKLVTLSVSFASGKLLVDAQQAVQARILYKIRLNKAMAVRLSIDKQLAIYRWSVHR